jgi:hypothetical protein
MSVKTERTVRLFPENTKPLADATGVGEFRVDIVEQLLSDSLPTNPL